MTVWPVWLTETRTDRRPEGVVEVEAGGAEVREGQGHEGGGQLLSVAEGSHTGPQHEGLVSARHAPLRLHGRLVLTWRRKRRLLMTQLFLLSLLLLLLSLVVVMIMSATFTSKTLI